MAVDMFINIKGIKGESRDKTHKNEIDVLAWSFGCSNSGNAHIGGGMGAGKANVQDLSFTAYVSKASPALMYHSLSGKHIPEATLVVRKAGENPLEYMKITMTDILVSSVSTGGSGGEDRLTENVSLNFAKVKFDYTEQTAQGGAGAQPNVTWDIAENHGTVG